MIVTKSEPLDWYTDKVVRGEHFTSLLYGDGEFIVADREATMRHMAYKEVVLPKMEDEILASLDDQSPDIIRGTDLHLVHWQAYRGQDWQSIKQCSERLHRAVGNRDLTFYDGTVWEFATRDGVFAPFLRAIKKRPEKLVFVGNPKLQQMKFLESRIGLFVPIPHANAYASIKAIEEHTLSYDKPAIYIICAGLTTIPLIMRLRKKLPQSTFLDLGSTFDLFVKLPSRGWRVDLYSKDKEYQRIIKANLEGV